MDKLQGTFWEEFENRYGHVHETKLKKIIKELGLSPKDIQAATGWSKSKLYELLAGTKPLTAKDAERLAPMFQMTAEELLIED